MSRVRLISSLCTLAVAMLAACSSPGGEEEESTTGAFAANGRWRLPSAVASEGEKVRLRYDDPGPYRKSACSGKLRAGANALGEFLQTEFDAVKSVGGYACRANTANKAKLSVHGTGRALDVFIPTTGGRADNTRGDKVANWLVTNAQKIGVQLVIWDGTVWMPNGKSDKPYTGPNPHTDHIHVEVTIPAAQLKTSWFQDQQLGDAGIDESESETQTEPETELPSNSDAGDIPEPDPEPWEPDPEPLPEDPTPTTEDAGKPSVPDTTGSTETSTGTPTSAPSEPTEEALEDDEPAESESTGTTSKTKKKSTTPDEEIVSGGCSAAPSSNAAGAAPLTLVLAASLLRRRRRSVEGR